MEDYARDDMKTQRSLKFNRYFYDNLMPIWIRRGLCFQSKNEISDKLMRNDFNAISFVTYGGTRLPRM